MTQYKSNKAGMGEIYFDEFSEITDNDIKTMNKLIDKSSRKEHRSMDFWRIVGCRIFGHKSDFKKTHIAVAPGLYCARCFSWISPTHPVKSNSGEVK